MNAAILLPRVHLVMQRHTLIKCKHRNLIGRRYTTEQNSLSNDSDEPQTLFLKMSNLNEEDKRTRKLFLEAEKNWDAQVQWSKLSKNEMEIVKIHKQAVLNGHFTYTDPKTSHKVMTRLKHFLRGTCCGSACRHCVYNHTKVPDAKKGTKSFNSAFWVEVTDKMK